ncbi:MAG: porin [Abditibacteriota bacterium]|nr:porin [Abditibacteriota bacterium]
MKKILFALATIGLIAIACAAFAQGAFVDVPTDHWAYDAVNQLQRVGIIVGYPDGTFGGKRAMTRYEFAVAIARLLPLLNGDTVISNDVDLSGYAKKSDIPSFNGASKGDLDALRKLVNEFGDELASLGVDVDALKRDVANLTARVEALEAENRRVRFTGDFFVGAKAVRGNGSDIDSKDLNPAGNADNNLLDNVNVFKNFDLNIVGRASDKVTVYSTINYGDYLDNFSANMVTANDPALFGANDAFYPTYLYAVADMGKTTITAGRFPLQWTPYTMKRIDWDSYFDYSVTDDGNYALDGIKADFAFGKAFNLNVFAAKNGQNRYVMDQFDRLGLAEQSAGARATFGLGKADLGVSYLETWFSAIAPPTDKVKVYGADLRIPFGSFCLGGEYAKAKRSGITLTDSEAWEAGIGYGLHNGSKLTLKGGYREVQMNYWAPAYFTKVGRMFNPSDIKGWFADAAYDFGSFSLYGGFQNYEPALTGFNGDLKDVKAGLKFKVGSKSSLQGEYEKAESDGYYSFTPIKSTFWTAAYNYKFNPQASLKIGYQFVTDDLGGAKNKGNFAFAQFAVSF